MTSAERPATPPRDGVRLQKRMAAAGVASRRASEILIEAGRVAVNGVVVTELGRRVQDTDLVSVDGVAVQLDPTRRYLMFNKPVGVVSSLRDEHGRPDLSRFVSGFEERLFNVGRLDAQTSGLLILTNDGELAHVLAHPSFGVMKTYVAKVEGTVTGADPREADRRHRAGGRADRRGQGAHHRRVPPPRDHRRAHPALRTQPHRAPDAAGGRPPGARAGAAAVRPAAPGQPRAGRDARLD